jgi:hypothetical protein
MDGDNCFVIKYFSPKNRFDVLLSRGSTSQYIDYQTPKEPKALMPASSMMLSIF